MPYLRWLIFVILIVLMWRGADWALYLLVTFATLGLQTGLEAVLATWRRERGKGRGR